LNINIGVRSADSFTDAGVSLSSCGGEGLRERRPLARSWMEIQALRKTGENGLLSPSPSPPQEERGAAPLRFDITAHHHNTGRL
jgi:hypothetical protein